MLVSQKVILMVIGLCMGGGLTPSDNMEKLAQLSIEDLIRVKVVSATKTEVELSDNAAAIFVLTQKDIQASGAVHLQDLLRLIPGVHVARLTSTISAISVRGFNDLHANKLLVLVDGRTIYNHLFSGVIWPMYDLPIADIQQIEVIRGPGATLWGANAVNGIINIITKKAKDTQGATLVLGSGNVDEAYGHLRFGGKLPGDGRYRAGYKAIHRTDTNYPLNQLVRQSDTWKEERFSFRMDWEENSRSQFRIQGNFFSYTQEWENLPLPRVEDSGHYLLTEWRNNQQNGFKTQIQFYYDHVARKDKFKYDLYDLTYQGQKTGENHDLIWGLGYRIIDDDVRSGLAGDYIFDPEKKQLELFQAFLQDSWTINQHFRLIGGTKFEIHEYTKEEIQPNLRFLWTPGQGEHRLWGSVAHGVRTPSRIDRDAYALLPRPPRPGPPFSPELRGNKDFDSGRLMAYELGYRRQFGAAFWADLAMFHNEYDRLEIFHLNRQGHWVLGNDMEATTFGGELTFEWRPLSWWRIAGVAAYLDMEVDTPFEGPRIQDYTVHVAQSNPEFTWVLRTHLILKRRWNLNLIGRHVDRVKEMAFPLPVAFNQKYADAYTVADVQLTWQPNAHFSFSALGRNLGDDHREYSNYVLEPEYAFQLNLRY